MTTAIIIVLLVGACVVAVRSYAKKLSRGCCGAGGDKERKVTKTADLAEYTFRYSVKIGGMSCKNCAARIANAFNRKAGFFARVDFKSGTAVVFTKELLPEIVIRQTVVGLGYSVEEMKQNEL